jgi:steroid delta-isomerase-like uncharacterized protein
MAERSGSDLEALNKRIVTQAVAAQCNNVFSPTDVERSIDQFFAKDFVVHDTFPGLARDSVGTKQWNALIREAVPDYNVTVDDQIAENDKVVTRWTARGTHKGKFQGIAPTGRQVSVTGMTISRFVDGKIAESWIELDTLSLMRQLGAHPSRDDHQLPGQGAGGVTFNITING